MKTYNLAALAAVGLFLVSFGANAIGVNGTIQLTGACAFTTLEEDCIGAYPIAGGTINVSGDATFDGGGAVTALTLSQVGSTGITIGDSTGPVALTFSGLAWTLSGSTLAQSTNGTATCDAGVGNCGNAGLGVIGAVEGFGDPNNDPTSAGGPVADQFEDSYFHWDNVDTRSLIFESFGANFMCFGGFVAEGCYLAPAADGYSQDGAFDASGSLSSTAFSNAGPGFTQATYATLSLNVIPVPAAVWLFGSALGLLGFVRRRVTA